MKVIDYRCVIRNMVRSDAINIGLNNSDSDDKPSL